MSDKLAISAALSVLMMSAYVLFGADVPRVPLGPSSGAGAVVASIEAALPSLPRLGDLLPR